MAGAAASELVAQRGWRRSCCCPALGEVLVWSAAIMGWLPTDRELEVEVLLLDCTGSGSSIVKSLENEGDVLA